MDTINWRFSSPVSPLDQALTPDAQHSSSAGTPVKVDWPYAVGSLDFNLFDNQENSCVQTFFTGMNPAWGSQGQYCQIDDNNTPLSPLEKLQRKWGIGDRKTRDGAPPKKRGPKPDSKPALTRRQELNRQAQRTHRERKENYMRELEITVSRLRKLYAEDVEKVKEENQKLKSILAAHGIQYDPTSTHYTSTPSNFGGSSTSLSGRASQSTGYTSPPSHVPQMPAPYSSGGSPSFHQQSPPVNALQPPHSNVHGLDYEEIGLDFVGTLEHTCMDHKQFLVHRSWKDENEISGHALMATVPPVEHVMEHGMDVQYPHKMPELPKPDLVRMLNICAALPGLNDEVTPVMAWAAILAHPRCEDMNLDDFQAVKTDLKAKVRCYGFGAVLEDFEIRDAIMAVLSGKDPLSSQMTMEWANSGIMEGVTVGGQ